MDRDLLIHLCSNHFVVKCLMGPISSLGTTSAWDQICECLMSAAIMVASRRKQRQPVWFVESEHLLSPLLSAKNDTWNGVLLHNSPASHRKFRQCE